MPWHPGSNMNKAARAPGRKSAPGTSPLAKGQGIQGSESNQAIARLAAGKLTRALDQLQELNLASAIELFLDALELVKECPPEYQWRFILNATTTLWRFAASTDSVLAGITAVTFARQGLNARGESDPSASNLLGLALLSHGGIEGDITLLEEAIRCFDLAETGWKNSSDSAWQRARINRAAALSRTGVHSRNFEALALIEASLEALPPSPLLEDYWRAKNTHFDILYNLGRIDEATATYDGLPLSDLSNFPIEQCRYFCNCAKTFTLNGKHEDAANSYKNAHDLKPEHSRLRYTIGNGLLAYAKILNADPNNASYALESAQKDLEWAFGRSRRVDAPNWPDCASALASAHTAIALLKNNKTSIANSVNEAINLYYDILLSTSGKSKGLPLHTGTSFHTPSISEIRSEAEKQVFGLMRIRADLPLGAEEAHELIKVSALLVSDLSTENRVTISNDLEQFIHYISSRYAVLLSSMVFGDRSSRSTDKPALDKISSSGESAPADYSSLAHSLRAQLEGAGIPRARWHRIFALVTIDADPNMAPPPSSIKTASGDGGANDISLVTARIAASGASTPPLPETPPELAWPTETYGASPEAGRGGAGIVAYMNRVWGELIAAGRVDLRTLRKVDKTAVKAIEHFTLRRDPKTGERLKLPAHLKLATVKQVNDQLLERAEIPLADASRLMSAARRRGRQLGQ
jgi:tetratricopeptide (TPR) repeat protein